MVFNVDYNYIFAFDLSANMEQASKMDIRVKLIVVQNLHTQKRRNMKVLQSNDPVDGSLIEI